LLLKPLAFSIFTLQDMAEYIVSARKYRPARFSDMVGQEHISTTLKNAIRNGQLAHSFLFCGPRGVGKTTAARILAKTINCENISADFEACGTCNSCTSFMQNSSFNIHELDAASNNSVEDIRSLVEQVRFPPQSGKYKIYIIDEVHMLSQGAFNAFLKTLEEPPPYCKFILATTEKHKILPTILSRCQIFDFRRIGVDIIVKHLRNICDVEKIDAEEDALHIIAQKADGGMRDALSMFDRLASFSGGKLTYESVLENLNVLDYDYFFKATDALLTENLAAVMQLFDQVLKKGFEGDDFVLGLCEHFRNLLFCKDAETLSLMEVSDNLKNKYGEQAQLSGADFLVNCLAIGNQCDMQYKASKNKRLTVELALVKMCYVNSVIKADDATGLSKKKLKSEPEQQQKAVTTEPLEEKKEAQQPTPVKPAAIADEPPRQQPLIKTDNPVLKKSNKFISVDLLNTQPDIIDEQLNKLEKSAAPFNGAILELNQENVVLIWDEYRERLPKQKAGLNATLSSYKPVYEAGGLTVRVESGLQKSTIDEVKEGIRTFYNRCLGAEIALEIIVDTELKPANTKPYTPKEKFERLIEKNPAIKKLQQKMGLELDYD
jgi:DNA polymerase-3 subunit gamma/tau